MEEKEELGQFLSNLAYQKPLKRRNYLNNSKYKNFILTNYNDNEYAVVLDKNTRNAYHIHRGTVNKKDVKTDFHLAMNNLKNSERYNQTLAKVKKSTTHLNQYKHVHVGHSLGGTLAQDISNEMSGYSISINRGTTPLENQKQLDTTKHIHYRDENDFISKFSKDNVTKSRKRISDSSFNNSMKYTSPFIHNIYKKYKAHIL